nr:MAG TPA: hypothetical protein [Caudoviricetes sp.]
MSGCRRSLLFCLNKQAANANDYEAKLKNFGCTQLGSPPFVKSGGKKLPPFKRADRYSPAAPNSI